MQCGNVEGIKMAENNLKEYLERQIKEYQEETESIKALYTDITAHIEECKKQIRSLKAKEDVGFSLLSPIAVDSAFQSQISRVASQQEAFEKQKEKYLSDLRFYEGKVQEMQTQLENYRNSESLRIKAEAKAAEELERLQRESAAATSATAISTEPARAGEAEQFRQPQPENTAEEPVAPSSAEQTEEARRQYTYILHKLTEIKGYLQLDGQRALLETDQLETYIRGLMD